MAVAAQLDINLAVSQSGANAFSSGPYWNAAMTLSQAFTDGVVANTFDRLYMAERTVASATNDDIDLSGVLTDVFGSTITAAELVGIFVINRAKDGTANTTNLTIGAGSNPVVGFLGGTTPTVGPLKPGGCFLLMNPDATGLATITAGTGDILRVANGSGATAKFQIALLMRSA